MPSPSVSRAGAQSACARPAAARSSSTASAMFTPRVGRRGRSKGFALDVPLLVLVVWGPLEDRHWPPLAQATGFRTGMPAVNRKPLARAGARQHDESQAI